MPVRAVAASNPAARERLRRIVQLMCPDTSRAVAAARQRLIETRALLVQLLHEA